MRLFAISRCRDGFSLSVACLEQYRRLSKRRLEWRTERDPLDDFTCTFLYDLDLEDAVYPNHEVPRDDPALIAAIESIGVRLAARTNQHEIKLVCVPDDAIEPFVPVAYDGFEHVAEKHRTWF